MTPSITEFTNEPLRQISQPKRITNMPDRQAYMSKRPIPPCVNEVKVVPDDEKEANNAFTEHHTV
jgi:hypothetical protein